MIRRLLLAAIIFAITPLACVQDEQGQGYTLLDETLDESPGKTQVSMNILVSESATDQELTSLLGQLLQDTSRRTDFRYHEHPTVIGIWAYASREHAESGMGQWEAMVAKTPLDPEPSVQIRLAGPRNARGTREPLWAHESGAGGGL